MSDLCHNCGDCHLGLQPIPCPQALQQCIICNNWGHTFNFCPLSVRHIDKNYQYWMLCHNCDRWHLPQPCELVMVTCTNCRNKGHMPTFCPLFPNARQWPPGDPSLAARPQSTSIEDGGVNESSYGMALVQDINKIHPDLLRQIQTQAISIICRQEETQQGRPALPTYQSTSNFPEPRAQHQHVHSLHRPVTQVHLGSFTDQRIFQQHPPTDSQELPTPMPSSAIKPGFVIEPAEAPSADGQEARTQGPHARYNNGKSPDEIAVSLPAPETAKKHKSSRKTRSQTSTCVSCRKSKRRCKHSTNDVTDTPTAQSDADEIEVSQPKAKKLKLSLESEGAGEAAGRTETQSVELSQQPANEAEYHSDGRNEPTYVAKQAKILESQSFVLYGNGHPAGDIDRQAEAFAFAAPRALNHPSNPSARQSNGGVYQDHAPAFHGNTDQYGWLQQSTNGAPVPLPALRSYADMPYQGTPGPAIFSQNLPSIHDAIAANDAADFNAGIYLASPDQMETCTDNVGMTQPISANDPLATDHQMQSRQSDDFSFADYGRIDGYQSASVQEHTKDPSGQMQYELTSSPDNDSIAPAQAEPAPKAKKAALRKKGGGRKSSTYTQQS